MLCRLLVTNTKVFTCAQCTRSPGEGPRTPLYFYFLWCWSRVWPGRSSVRVHGVDPFAAARLSSLRSSGADPPCPLLTPPSPHPRPHHGAGDELKNKQQGAQEPPGATEGESPHQAGAPHFRQSGGLSGPLLLMFENMETVKPLLPPWIGLSTMLRTGGGASLQYSVWI